MRLCTAWRSTDHVQDIARNKRTRAVCGPARSWRHLCQVHAEVRVGKQGQHAGHYHNEVARTPPAVVLVVHFCVFDAMPKFILCVCRHLFCYIYVLCMHVQMNATPAFVRQPWAPMEEVGFTAPHVVVLNHKQQAPPFSTSNDNLCDSCQAEDERQRMYGVMPLQCIPPPESQGVDCVPPCQPAPQSQCMPPALQGVHYVLACDPQAQSQCMPPVASDCNTQYILPAAAPGSMPAFFGMQNTPHIAPSAAGVGTLTKATHAFRGMFMPPETPRHHTVLVKIKNTPGSAPTRTSSFWSRGPQRANRRSR